MRGRSTLGFFPLAAELRCRGRVRVGSWKIHPLVPPLCARSIRFLRSWFGKTRHERPTGRRRWWKRIGILHDFPFECWWLRFSFPNRSPFVRTSSTEFEQCGNSSSSWLGLVPSPPCGKGCANQHQRTDENTRSSTQTDDKQSGHIVPTGS
ncbi:septum formation initiator [Anopheles sinensis]|uniref:Septum formation initiator n=1 Tax=Anopheles sinensis TaxID=74873 RepID=A0A084WE28_ANOSI|nr:septum formation initiator [Anopheles sinensis]